MRRANCSDEGMFLCYEVKRSRCGLCGISPSEGGVASVSVSPGKRTGLLGSQY